MQLELKGECPETFDFRFFSRLLFPQDPEFPCGDVDMARRRVVEVAFFPNIIYLGFSGMPHAALPPSWQRVGVATRVSWSFSYRSAIFLSNQIPIDWIRIRIRAFVWVRIRIQTKFVDNRKQKAVIARKNNTFFFKLTFCSTFPTWRTFELQESV